MNVRPLDGIRVLEVAQLVAAPTAGAWLGYFGARVIKIEKPGSGDPLRDCRTLEDGTSLWWRGIARNKESVVLYLGQPEGRKICADLAARSDVLLENFRPGTMESWGLGPDELRARNPGLIYARISGYGQTGPRASEPGFASVCEAEGGLRHLIGEPGRPPLRANLSLGDTVAGLHAALRHRDIDPEHRGQIVDVAITESVFGLLESVVTEYAHASVVRDPAGTGIDGFAPSNAFPCRDGRWIVVGANTDGIFRRLAEVMGRADWNSDPSLASNAGRVARSHELDAEIGAWCRERESADVVATLRAAGVAVGRIQDASDLVRDPQLLARGAFETAAAEGREYLLPAMFPKLEATPGRTDWAGPALGAHTDRVLADVLGLEPDAIAGLRTRGVIG